MKITDEITVDKLALWIESVKTIAENDTDITILWFIPTIDKPYAIVAGWQKMFDKDYSDLFCCSKSHPEYVMCIKVAVNDGMQKFDLDSFDMPVDSSGNVDDTCIPLEWDDSAELVAEFFMHEWERIMTEHGEEI